MRHLSHGRAARGMVRFLRKHFGKSGLLTKPESSDDLLIPGPVFARQVLQELVAAADQFQQAAPRRMVLLMLVEVLPELIDARRDDRDLHFRRAGIFIVSLVIFDDLRLLLCGDRHREIAPPRHQVASIQARGRSL
jgi:hypothetical protein